MQCPKCKQAIKDNSLFCDKCGAKIPRCPTCGRVLTKPALYCTEDGTPIPEDVLKLIPNSEQISSSMAGTNKADADRASTNRASADRASTNRTGVNRVGVNQAGADRASLNRTSGRLSADNINANQTKRSFCVSCGNPCAYGEKLCDSCKSKSAPVQKGKGKSKGIIPLVVLIIVLFVVLAGLITYALFNDMLPVSIGGRDTQVSDETDDESGGRDDEDEDEEDAEETTEETTEKTTEETTEETTETTTSAPIASSNKSADAVPNAGQGTGASNDAQLIYNLMNNYCSSMCSAINTNSYGIVEGYILKGSSLETSQKGLVSRLYSNGTTESFVSCYVNSIDWRDSMCYVYVTETENVNYADGTIKTLTYNWKYTAVLNNGSWKLSNIEQG